MAAAPLIGQAIFLMNDQQEFSMRISVDTQGSGNLPMPDMNATDEVGNPLHPKQPHKWEKPDQWRGIKETDPASLPQNNKV